MPRVRTVLGREKAGRAVPFPRKPSSRCRDQLLGAKDQLQRRNQELTVLNAVVSAVSRHLELTTVLNVALRETLALMRVGGGIIYLYDKTRHSLAPAAHSGLSAALLREIRVLRLGQSYSGAVASSRKPLVIRDIRGDARALVSPSAVRGFRAYAGIPMLSRRKLLGVVALLDYKVDRFTEEDVALLGRIAKQVGVAIENAQLYEEVRRELAARRQTEAALQESEARFRVVFAHSLVGIALTTLQGRILHANPALQEMLGYTAEELQGKSFREITHPDEADAVRNHVQAVIRGKQSSVPLEKRYLHKDGRIIWAEVNCSLHRDAAGKPLFVISVIRDITGRKWADKERARSAERYRQLFENSGTGVTIVDKDGRYLMVNKVAAAEFGVPPEEVVGKSMLDLLPAATARKYLDLNRRFIKRGGRRVYEDTFSLPAGERTFLIVDRCLKDENGRNFAIQSSSVDITDRKQAKEALSLSEAKYRRLHESIRDAFASVDMKGRILECNAPFEQLLGYSAKELRRLTCFDLTPKRWHALESRILRDQVLKRGTSDVYEKEYRRKDGTVLPVELRTYLIREPSGRPAGMWAIVRDITERKRAEEALRESEQRFRQLAETMPDAMLVGQDGRNVYANPAAARLLCAAGPQDLVSMDAFALIDPARREWARQQMQRILAGEKPPPFEDRFVRLDGSLVPLEIAVSLITWQGRPAIQVTARDITERKQAEERLRIYQKRLRSMALQLALTEERERRRLATALHDEVSQALALARIKLGELAEASPRPEFTARVLAIYAMIAQVLTRTRSLTFELSPPVLYELGFENALAWLVEEFQKQHPIRWQFMADRLPTPLDDDARVTLFHGARELLFNAVKHARPQTVTVLVECDSGEVRVRVEDDGVGFAVDELWSNPKATRGFGLFSIRERLESLGGRLEVDSQPGRGTRATLAVPLASSDVPSQGE